MNRVRVGIMRGGTSILGYRRSISDGAILLRALREHDEYEPVDILIDKSEVWHIDGVPTTPEKIVHKIDVCLSTIEKPLKKEGYAHVILRTLGVKVLHTPPSALRGYIPESLKEKIRSVGVRMPRHIEIGSMDDGIISYIHKNFSPPYSIHFVNVDGVMQHIFHATTLEDVHDVFTHHEKTEIGNYMVEDFIPGEKWAITVIPGYRGMRHYTTHPVYLGLVNPPFRSNIPVSRSAMHGFADPATKESLDLYAKLVSSAIDTNHPKTLIFHFEPKKKPVLMRIIDRHLLHDDYLLTSSMKESGITEADFVKLILDRN